MVRTLVMFCMVFLTNLPSARALSTLTGAYFTEPDVPGLRAEHAAVELLDGTVLVCGGFDLAQFPVATTARYLPYQNSWQGVQPPPPMTTPRQRPTATRLLDGRVLVAGGLSTGGVATSAAEIFNPATNSWTSIPSMRANRYGHTATLLPNGRVFVVGGQVFNSGVIQGEEYDPSTNNWNFVGSSIGITINLRFHAAILNAASEVVFGGGIDFSDFPQRGGLRTEVFLYRPGTQSYATHPPLMTARAEFAMAPLTDPTFLYLAVGGRTPSGITASCERFDGLAFVSAAPLANARRFHTLDVTNGGVLALGGRDTSPTQGVAVAEIYAGNSWIATPTMITPRWNHTATVLSDGSVFVAGGLRNGSPTNRCETFLPPGGFYLRASTSTPMPIPPGYDLTCTLVGANLMPSFPVIAAVQFGTNPVGLNFDIIPQRSKTVPACRIVTRSLIYSIPATTAMGSYFLDPIVMDPSTGAILAFDRLVITVQ